MSANKYQPHVYLLPEDDANLRLATGFQLHDAVRYRQMQVLPVAGGWTEVLKSFLSNQVPDMERYPGRSMVLLIDFDSREERLQEAKARIPENLVDRVFILGVWTEPEDLRASLGDYETVGKALAEDCRAETNGTWGHALLRHNADEIERMRKHVRPILFL